MGAFGDAAVVSNGFGGRYVFESVLHKFHACCHGTHATLEAMTEARDRNDLSPDDVRAVKIWVHPQYLRICNIEKPTTGLEAKFSLRLTAAMILAQRDTAALSTFDDRACEDRELVALRDRTLVDRDPALSETTARIQIDRVSGPPIEACHGHCHINWSISQLGQPGAKVRSRRWRFAKPRTMWFEALYRRVAG